MSMIFNPLDESKDMGDSYIKRVTGVVETIVHKHQLYDNGGGLRTVSGSISLTKDICSDGHECKWKLTVVGWLDATASVSDDIKFCPICGMKVEDMKGEVIING